MIAKNKSAAEPNKLAEYGGLDRDGKSFTKQRRVRKHIQQRTRAR